MQRLDVLTRSGDHVVVNAGLEVSIEYCTKCNFRSRAVWLAQELLAAHELELTSLTLVPSSGGILAMRIAGEVAFSNLDAGRFPEPRELKDIIRSKLGLEPVPRHE